MIFPDFLEPFREKALLQLQKHFPKELLFSGPTYQVLCSDDTKAFWVFVQIDKDDLVKDIFCSCEDSTKGGCWHMAMALAAIFSKSHPLHKAFEDSPWEALFAPYITTLGPLSYEDGTLHLGKHCIFGNSKKVEALFHSLTAKEETDETSIKFSDVPEEEVEAWRAGKVSNRLRRELSLSMDLAKQLFILHITEGCCFEWKKTGSHHRLVCHFHSLVADIFVQGPLPPLLDRLAFEKSDPPIHPFGGRKLSHFFFENESCHAQFSGKAFDISKSTDLGGGWSFGHHGFVRLLPEQFQSPLQELPSLLDKMFSHMPITPLRYSVEVCQKGISISAYLQQPKDIERMEGKFFGNWLWMNNRFIRIDHPRYKTPECIPSEQVSSFLIEHTSFLSEIPGCTVHERPLEMRLSYEVGESGALVLRKQNLPSSHGPLVQLDSWIFLPGEGFFPKHGTHPIPIDQLIVPHKIPAFVKQHMQFLREIPDFFAQQAPIHGVGLDIVALRNAVRVLPVYQWDDPSYATSARIYDDLGYIPGIGFFFLPQLLVQSHFKKTIQASDVEAWNQFFSEQLPQLKNEFSCKVDPRLEPPKTLRLICHQPDLSKVDARVVEGTVFWESELGKVSAKELLQAMRRGRRWFVSNAGLLDLHDQRFGWLFSVPVEDVCQLRPADFLKIRAHDTLDVEQPTAPASTFIAQLLHDQPIPSPQLDQLRSTLRQYQRLGAEWLWHLYNTGLSGLLCDDMGVGKTYQAMALLCASFTQAKLEQRTCKFFIVCPTSIIWHWRDKLAEVLPHLRVCCRTASERCAFSDQDDVLLTSYGIVRSDIKLLKTHHFEVAIFDELQIAKNHVSQVWAALSQIRASMRLGLTGTPIENDLRELKALFDIVLPGYFPNERFFREYYIRPIERGHSEERRSLLARYVQPFVLRRRKADVLPELPSKTEEVYQTDLIGEQKTLYHQVATHQGLPLIDQLRDTSAPIPYMHIFALLSALKQVCNHPASYFRDEKNFTRYESGKWEIFVELLEEALEGNLKVVVFSQFLSMLDIIGNHLSTQKIGYTELRGSTRRRGDVIARFREDPSCRVFLGSLQAAGLGIDLTAASVVIHYDRWWNAARENQATDRVHRLGQSRGVFVYKLMTRHSVEENIDRMIARKAKLLDEVVGYDDHRVIRKLQRNELLELLEGIQEPQS